MEDESLFAPKLASPSEKTILIVDDEENIRGLIEMAGKHEGFKVISACDGEDANAKIASHTPDLIVADLMMPKQGGYEFLRGLHSSGHGRIPVFVITGSSLDSSTVAMIRQERNVVEFFAKPLRLAPFLALLHQHLKTAPPVRPPEGQR